MSGIRQIVVTVFLASATALIGCDSKTPAASSPPVVTGLSVARAEEQQMPDGANATGTVRAKEASVLSAQTMGRVVNVTVHEGDAVRAGQVLLTLDNAQAGFDVARARAAVASSEQSVKLAETQAGLADSTLKRYELLREHKAVSPQEFDEVARKAQSAAAQLDAARAQAAAAKADSNGAGAVAAYGRIVAPFAGFITARRVDPGAMAMPGMPLLEIEKAGTLQLTTSVDESLVRSLQKGMSVAVRISALKTPMVTGHIAEIDPAGDAGSHSFMVKIDLPAVDGLRTGMFGTASIGNTSHAVVVVPQAAVVTHGSLNAVWVLDANHIASLRYVTLGAASGGGVVVLSGLSAGEMVVLSPEDRELGGSKVEVRS